MSNQQTLMLIVECLRQTQKRLRIRTQDGMAAELEMPLGTYKMRLQKPYTFRVDELLRIKSLAKRAGIDISETGVPFL